MNTPIVGLRVASVVFGLMALAQLGRLVMQAQVVVAGFEMPLWLSALALAVLAGLGTWLWMLSRR